MLIAEDSASALTGGPVILYSLEAIRYADQSCSPDCRFARYSRKCQVQVRRLSSVVRRALDGGQEHTQPPEGLRNSVGQRPEFASIFPGGRQSRAVHGPGCSFRAGWRLQVGS